MYRALNNDIVLHVYMHQFSLFLGKLLAALGSALRSHSCVTQFRVRPICPTTARITWPHPLHMLPSNRARFQAMQCTVMCCIGCMHMAVAVYCVKVSECNVHEHREPLQMLVTTHTTQAAIHKRPRRCSHSRVRFNAAW